MYDIALYKSLWLKFLYKSQLRVLTRAYCGAGLMLFTVIKI